MLILIGVKLWRSRVMEPNKDSQGDLGLADVAEVINELVFLPQRRLYSRSILLGRHADLSPNLFRC